MHSIKLLSVKRRFRCYIYAAKYQKLGMCCVFDDFFGLWHVCCLLLGIREAEINVAEGKKQARILSSEAYQREQINQAQGLCLTILVHGQVTIIFVVSVGLFVCAEFFSAIFGLISIKLGHMLYVWV